MLLELNNISKILVIIKITIKENFDLIIFLDILKIVFIEILYNNIILIFV